MGSNDYAALIDAHLGSLIDQGGAFGLSRTEAVAAVVIGAGRAVAANGQSSASGSDWLLNGYVTVVANNRHRPATNGGSAD